MFIKIDLEKFRSLVVCFERSDNRTHWRTKYTAFTLSLLLPIDVLSRTGQTCASMKLQGEILPEQRFRRGAVWSENLCWWPLKGEHVCSLAFVALAMEAYFCFAELVNLAMPMSRSKKKKNHNKQNFCLKELALVHIHWVLIQNQTKLLQNTITTFVRQTRVSRLVAYLKHKMHHWSPSLQETQPAFSLLCCPAPLLVGAPFPFGNTWLAPGAPAVRGARSRLRLLPLSPAHHNVFWQGEAGCGSLCT